MRARASLLAVLFSLMLVSVAYAQESGTVTYTTYVPGASTCDSAWACTDPSKLHCNAVSSLSINIPDETTAISVAILALTISMDVIAIGYILTKLAPGTGVGTWLNNEYWELAKSVLVIIIIYGALTAVANLAVTFLGLPASGYYGNIGNLVSADELYLCNSQIYALATWNFIGLESIAVGLLQGSTVAFYLPIPIPWPPFLGFAFEFGFTMNPYQNFLLETGNVVIQHLESGVYDMTNYVAFPVTLLLNGFVFMIPLLIDIGLGILIPLGLIFRAFPFVRGIGGTLIAIGIGIALVFPALLALFNAPISSAMASFTLAQAPTTGACVGGDIICTFINLIDNVLSNFKWIFTFAWDSWFSLYPVYNQMLATGTYLVVQLILFAFDILIIYTVTDNIARSLGGTIRLSLGSKIRIL
jgi:hypothetical protein